MTPKVIPLDVCICWFKGARVVVVLINLGPVLPSSMATWGMVGAGGNGSFAEHVPNLIA